MKKFLLSLLGFFLISTSVANVKLPAIFGHGMVLQRGLPVRVWGWADAGEMITVTLQGNTATIKADRRGKWLVKLPALAAGGPYELTVQGKNKVVLNDLLIGDVWICGGQSNMQWNVAQTGYVEADTVFLKHGQVRLFTVQIEMDYFPKEDVKSTGWNTLTAANINAFSAVAYHFGKYLFQNTQVPVGLISDNLGATAAEAWMSNEALMEFPQFKTEVEPVVKEGKNFEELQAAFEKSKAKWYTKYYYKGKGVEEQWYKPATDVSDWKPIKASGNTWTEIPELASHDGAVWFRTTFDLPENYAQETFHLSLSQIDDYDIAWVNGEKVGETYGRHNHRGYTVPVKLLKPKGNVLVVRVFDVGGIGGFTTSEFWGNTVLWGNWIYKKGEAIDAATFPKVNLRNATPFSSPAVLYNGCIAPLTSFPIKGAIWYQGESNVERAYEYRTLFPAMIKDWRKQWKQGDFPFLFVQLANFMDESAEPKESNWAELREAQALTLAMPATGMATAIDIGEANDIHPKNKKDVGTRLAMAALHVAYGKRDVFTGPTFKAYRVEGDRVIITYDNTGTGLVSKDKYGYVRGFQVAGEDRKFRWARATVQGNTVVVQAEGVEKPVAVRYAWDNNPGPLDLYNKEGLPAHPFRTDAWPGVTEGAVFKDGPRF